MRTAWINHLRKAAADDSRIFLVVGDLGFSVVEGFANEFPDRFLNAGVAEQNMIAVAAGLAKVGFRVFVYSIGNFVTMRCLEQIRNDVCLHGLAVYVVTVGGGFMYGPLGPTHHLTEDIAVMRVMPGMRVFVPFCGSSVRRVVEEVVAGDGPAYIRLGRRGVEIEAVEHNGLTLIRRGDSAGESKAVVSVGQLAAETLEYASGLQADLFALCRLKPLPRDDLVSLFSSYREIIVVEDHQIEGGAYSALSEFAGRLGVIGVRGFAMMGGREKDLRGMLMHRVRREVDER